MKPGCPTHTSSQFTQRTQPHWLDTKLWHQRLPALAPQSPRLKPAPSNPTLPPRTQLYWPDDNLWYHVEIAAINVRNKSAKIIYTTGEEEDLDLEEIVRDGHMSLFPL